MRTSDDSFRFNSLPCRINSARVAARAQDLHACELHVTVKDDGIGLRSWNNGGTNGHLNGNGVLNMAKRAEEIGGKFKMSANGQGMEVRLEL